MSQKIGTKLVDKMRQHTLIIEDLMTRNVMSLGFGTHKKERLRGGPFILWHCVYRPVLRLLSPLTALVASLFYF